MAHAIASGMKSWPVQVHNFASGFIGVQSRALQVLRATRSEAMVDATGPSAFIRSRLARLRHRAFSGFGVSVGKLSLDVDDEDHAIVPASSRANPLPRSPCVDS